MEEDQDEGGQHQVTVNMVSLIKSIKNTVEKLDQDIRECKNDIKECKKDIKDVKERHENRDNNDNARLSVRGNSRFKESCKCKAFVNFFPPGLHLHLLEFLEDI